MIIKPKIRNNVCLSAHPVGCKLEVERQIEYVKSRSPIESGPKRVLVLGASGGYGLASRIVAAFGSGASTIGVAFEKAGSDRHSGTAGYYNMRAFEEYAKSEGLFCRNFNGDAFSDEVKQEVISCIKEEMGEVDLVVYSLAAPVRKAPGSDELYRSSLKPIGSPYKAKSLDFMAEEVNEVSIEPATEEEIEGTIKVMGGEDWELWIKALMQEGVLAEGVKTVAYSYIGPEVTQDIYRRGTIGKAKEHIEATAETLHGLLAPLKGSAYISVNKALVTRAAAVIPVVALYIAVLYKIMKKKGLHEGSIEQMYRLYKERLYTRDGDLKQDDKRIVRIDDLEMREDVQKEVDAVWDSIKTESVAQYADIEGYRNEFLRTNGFGIDGVDYDEEVDPH